MSKIKAILIDPFACTVTEVEVDGGDHRSYYPLLSHATMSVDTFTTAYPGILTPGDAVFVDDEGLLKNPERFFMIATAHQPFAGKGLIVGSDEEGECADCLTSLNLVRMSVMFGEMVDGRLAVTRTPWERDDGKS